MTGSRTKVSRMLSYILAALGLVWPTMASANGAMSLAFATFAWTPWLIYVAVTVLFEAAAMGKWLRISFLRALKCSLTANFFTAIVGGFISGPISYSFLGMFGSTLNPNPFGQTLTVFTLFGIGSALVEFSFWNKERDITSAPPDADNRTTVRISVSPATVLARCLAVHLVGIPLGLAVLLMPARPYPGLEGQVSANRMYRLVDFEVKRALEQYMGQHEALPNVRSYEELLQVLKPTLERSSNDPGLWAAAYIPEYERFDTGERRRNPIEWNTQISGKNPYLDTGIPGKKHWLIRARYRDGYCWGLLLEGNIRRTTDPAALGYTPTVNHPNIP